MATVSLVLGVGGLTISTSGGWFAITDVFKSEGLAGGGITITTG